jgi:hypothetical protein
MGEYGELSIEHVGAYERLFHAVTDELWARPIMEGVQRAKTTRNTQGNHRCRRRGRA